MALKFIETKNNKKFARRDLLIGFCALLAIAVSFIFPQKSPGEAFWLSLFLFAVFPIIVIRFLLKEPLSKHGLTLGKRRAGTIAAILFAAVAIALMSVLTKYPGIRNQIHLLPGIAGSFTYFLWTELIVVPVIFLSREFFFRGFLQLGLEEKMGYWIIPTQAIFFALPFVRSSWLELIYALLSALAAGLIVRFSRSIFYSFTALWIISFVIDILIIRMTLRGI